MEALTSADGKTLKYTNATGSVVSGGTLVNLAGRAGVTVSDVADTKDVAAMIVGIFNIVKKNLSFSDGENLYWDENGDPVGGVAGSGAATNVSGDGDFELGACIGAIAGGTARAPVLLNYFDLAGVQAFSDLSDVGVTTKSNGRLMIADSDSWESQAVSGHMTIDETGAVTFVNAFSNVIADPGDAGAIPVTASGYCPLVTVAGETRTLADPTFAGQVLAISLKTDGGDAVLTVASPINQQANTVFTFAAIGDTLVLIAVEDGADIEWRIALIDGVTGITGKATSLSNTIADPGDGNAIPVTSNGVCDMVSGGSETRTLSNPLFAGQQILLNHKTDGGAVVVTAASTVNQTGNTIMTFTEVDDSIILYGNDSNGTLEWRVMANDGVVLS